ncbi:tetratricopeptide repeat-containing sensor histidine kinase [Dyadobacter psychrotolerans]|uniref:histidine kinase n=1 Tax=Dyadobacter psychrotolerans TaxID=2541721 RepID=A0A4V2Z2Y3_9BACT|nr:ATP-binding protein [Dyadobacter psychrotolerans]TDE10558.1 GHKL domain-containing protein [Dyadobacter psychrotolerans]
MKHVLLILVLLAVTSAEAVCQIPDLRPYKTLSQKLKRLQVVCDSLAGKGKISEEKIVARHGLKLTPANDLLNLAKFHFYLGFVYGELGSDSSVYHFEKSIDYSRKAKNPEAVKNALERVMFTYSSFGKYKEKARLALKELLAIIDTTKSEPGKVDMMATIGNYYGMNGQYEKQMQLLLRGIEIKKRLIASGKIKDREDVVADLMNLGELYVETDQAEVGFKYIQEARKYIVAYPNYIAHYYKDMADVLLILDKPSQARVYYDSLTAMLTPANKSSVHRSNRIASDLAFTEYYLTNNKTDSASIHISRAVEMSQKWPDEYLTPQIDYMRGKVYFARKEFAKALTFLESSEPLARDSDPQMYVSHLQLLAQSYGAAGQWKQAYNTYEKYAPLRDSLYIEASKKSIADAEAHYQNKDKQLQIELKNVQIDDAKKQRIWFISGLALLAFSLALLGVIYRNKKQNAEILDAKNRQMEKLIGELEEANRTKAKLFSIISHDLRSPISQVYQFLKLQQLNPKLLNDTQRAELSERIQTATGSLLETMEDLLLWSKTQMNQFQADVQPTSLLPVVSQCLKLLQLNIEAKKLNIETLISHEMVVQSDPYYLQAIVRNLLQNAIKATEESGVIRVGITGSDENKALSIENSGPVFTQEDYIRILSQKDNTQGLSGLGLRLVDELSEKTGLKIRFENPDGNLTRALVVFG